MKHRLWIFLLLCFGIVSCSSNKNSAQSDCLKKAAYKIESLDIDEDDSDLLFLKKIMDDDSVKIVLVGEQGHNDGTTFTGKARLVKFLHEKCGFDVLAFESGFYDCAKGWELAQQYNDYEIGLKGSVFGLWSFAKEFEPITEYLNSTLKSSNPVILAGIDNALTGSFSTDYFVSDLKKLNLIDEKQNDSEKILTIIKSQMLNPFSPTLLDSVKINSGIHLLDVILSRLDTLNASSFTLVEKEFWVRAITGLKAKCFSLLNDPNTSITKGDLPPSNKRDAIMAGNLIWLFEKKYPGKKIIVWTANFHGCRALENIQYDQQFLNSYTKKTITMGDSLYKTYGKRIYNISFTDYESDFSSKATDSTFEFAMNKTGYKYAFLNLRNPASLQCLDNDFITKILVNEGKGDWRRVTDGIFFIKEIKKSNIQK